MQIAQFEFGFDSENSTAKRNPVSHDPFERGEKKKEMAQQQHIRVKQRFFMCWLQLTLPIKLKALQKQTSVKILFDANEQKKIDAMIRNKKRASSKRQRHRK